MADQNGAGPEKLGLATNRALRKLYDDILDVLQDCEREIENETLFERLRFLMQHQNPMSWFSVGASYVCIVLLFLNKNFICGLLLLVLVIFTIALQIRENRLRKTELHRKTATLLDDIDAAITLCEDWQPENYPHIFSPLSPCVSLQWAYRDGKIVNLPWALLVAGDHVVIRPGQIVPVDCTEINGKYSFTAGETYRLTHPIEPPPKPTARAPMPDLVCVLSRTPFIENLQTALGTFLNRPPTIYDQQRDLLIHCTMQKYGVILVALITYATGVLRYTGTYVQGKTGFHWREAFVESPVASMLPILPLVYPIIWTMTNLWGMARLETILKIPKSLLQNENQRSFQEDLDTPTMDLDYVHLPHKNVLYHWIQLLNGSSHLLGRSTNVVQVLGTVTALCCVDKKGILSWPNPTAEKLFFFRDANSDTASRKSSRDDLESDTSEQPSTVVLDLTHDQHSPFKLEFDDHEWKNHINSLKPLGLAVLLNTCCPLTQEHYTKFCGHISAQFDKNLVPVTNRRCLCELARQIGFKPKARDVFSLSGQISSYRHLQPEVVKRDMRFAKSLHISKVKVPFPHSMSVVIKEVHSHSLQLQLLTQGTADLVLDCCDDYWNGTDLRLLTKEDRKRALDFYQRNALTAYCTAFSYRPLRHGVCGSLSGQNNEEVAYLELPPESKYRMSHAENSNCDEYEEHKSLAHSLSTDSLLFSDFAKEEDIADVEGCFEMQCHQIFIGMCTMQYQAQTDVVQLIEQLDRACIRFVHFSKENELRSRVFSEKMGLESGWNCHISLLSDEQSSLPSPKTSANITVSQTHVVLDGDTDECHRLLVPSTLESSKTLSSSAPCAISNQDDFNPACTSDHDSHESIRMADVSHRNSSVTDHIHRASRDSAMDENCRSLSCLSDLSEHSAPINFDMSNRAKLPRGIENIRPHLENVDNVPLLVSLFTDCSAEATREMLSIMQEHGEIVVCLGSSASNANCEIFLQADCSIGIEPLYPQVCQDYPAFNESNIYNNKANIKTKSKAKIFNFINETPVTISPVYLSRQLNSLPCSISMMRDDSLSFVTLIELSRRFTSGQWNCIQFWACCACSFALLNTLITLITLPPILTPAATMYLMCIAVPLIAIALVRIEPDPSTMNRATGKKHTSLDQSLVMFVLWCYGCKFLPMIITMLLAFCVFLSHPVIVINNDNENYEKDLDLARNFITLGIIYHITAISSTFVHRDYSAWSKNPLRNMCWVASCATLIILHTVVIIFQIATNSYILDEMDRIWPIFLGLVLSTLVTYVVAEFCKWQEIKANSRYQRRARLDFGTKLGMNSPF